jgi:hypothetical protein
VQTLISRAGVRATCEGCGEEIINEREVMVEGRILCRGCAHGGYYRSLDLLLPAQAVDAWAPVAAA